MIKSIAGIGSRGTPPEILEEMKKIGAWCGSKQIEVRSGHADGADWAFEQGAQRFCTAFIPWQGFNVQLKSRANLIVPFFSAELFKTVDMYHPAPERLNYGVRKIMARNACQILGVDLDESVDAVVCWTIDGRDSGGTGQALRIAAAKGIPIYNMRAPDLATANNVIKTLLML